MADIFGRQEDYKPIKADPTGFDAVADGILATPFTTRVVMGKPAERVVMDTPPEPIVLGEDGKVVNIPGGGPAYALRADRAVRLQEGGWGIVMKNEWGDWWGGKANANAASEKADVAPDDLCPVPNQPEAASKFDTLVTRVREATAAMIAMGVSADVAIESVLKLVEWSERPQLPQLVGRSSRQRQMSEQQAAVQMATASSLAGQLTIRQEAKVAKCAAANGVEKQVAPEEKDYQAYDFPYFTKAAIMQAAANYRVDSFGAEPHTITMHTLHASTVARWAGGATVPGELLGLRIVWDDRVLIDPGFVLS